VHFGFESVEALAQKLERSDLRIIAFDSRPEKVERARQELAAAGLYGDRIAVHVGNPTSVDLPPYLASQLVCTEAGGSAETLKMLYDSVRPYGGRLYVPVGADRVKESL